MEEQGDFVYAIEIEEATLGAIWRHPELLEPFKARCDPLTHLSQPHLRILLRAINLAYAEVGIDLDWAVVISVLREMGALADCGGLEGLNHIYALHEAITPPAIFTDYLRLLTLYAQARDAAPRKVSIFTGGKGTLYLNKAKKQFSHDDFIGQLIVEGTLYQVSAEVSPDGTKINLRLQ